MKYNAAALNSFGTIIIIIMLLLLWLQEIWRDKICAEVCTKCWFYHVTYVFLV